MKRSEFINKPGARASTTLRTWKEPSYPLELAKELGIGQQLVSAHLGILERGGIVGCSLEASPYGPNRRLYFLNKSVYLTLCFGPHLYIERNLYFENLPSGVSQDAEELIAKIGHIKRSVKENGKIGSYSNVISDVDGKLENIEAEKLVLLYVRNLAMKRASELMDETKKTHDKKRVLHYVLDERNRDVERISTALNLHESVVRAILESLKKDLSEV